MATKPWAFGLVLFCTLLTSAAQIFYKLGANRLEFNFISLNDFIMSLVTNYPLMAGFFIYGIGAVLLITALKGGELSVLYPIIATSYIWVSFLSVRFFNESINIYRWIGIITIIFGISFIGLGSKKNSASEYTEAV